MKRPLYLVLGIAFLLPVSPWLAQGDTAPAAPSFAGTWDTTFGTMKLTQDGTKVKGTYSLGDSESTIEGTVEKGKLAFTYKEPAASGKGWFELSPDGQSFKGKWLQDGTKAWAGWAGTRAVAASAAAAAHSFAGTWETTFGTMKLTQDGNKVKGTYSLGGVDSTIEGTAEKGKLTFRYKEPTVGGEGWFVMAPDGKSFRGRWREDGRAVWGDWAGNRVSRGGFDGIWETSFGRMRLVVDGASVKGRYAYAGGSAIAGKLDGKKLTFTYKEPAGVEGEGVFELAADGKTFAGKWREKGKGAWQPWKGKAVEPVPGRVWLVVLEANWERDLSDKEYAFGAMLRAFFSRDRRVQIRHRWFTDEASLRRWCSEVTYLAEPVVVSIASHGTSKGLPAGGKFLGADVLADCLKQCPNVKLLHFSACLMMKDNLAKDMLKNLEKDGSPFPISGYATSVDWAASAVIEFMYFDMVLCRKMDPRVAAGLVPKMMPFAGDSRVPGAPIPGAGFRIVAPGDK